jgi:hypothetical protein
MEFDVPMEFDVCSAMMTRFPGFESSARRLLQKNKNELYGTQTRPVSVPLFCYDNSLPRDQPSVPKPLDQFTPKFGDKAGKRVSSCQSLIALFRSFMSGQVFCACFTPSFGGKPALHGRVAL